MRIIPFQAYFADSSNQSNTMLKVSLLAMGYHKDLVVANPENLEVSQGAVLAHSKNEAPICLSFLIPLDAQVVPRCEGLEGGSEG